VKLTIEIDGFVLEIKPTSKHSLEVVKGFLQSIVDTNGDKRGPGRPKKGPAVSAEQISPAPDRDGEDDKIIKITN
jgi:hypothetical protein